MSTYDRRAGEDPTVAYDKATADVARLLDSLKAKLAKHRKKFEKKPTSWGFVGDLNHLVEELTDLDKFMG
jgi:ribosome-interacting GTPase 1